MPHFLHKEKDPVRFRNTGSFPGKEKREKVIGNGLSAAAAGQLAQFVHACIQLGTEMCASQQFVSHLVGKGDILFVPHLVLQTCP